MPGQSFDSFISNRSFGSPGNFGSVGGGTSWTETFDRSKRTLANGAPNPYYNPNAVTTSAPVAAPRAATSTPAPSSNLTGGGMNLSELTATADPWSSQRGQYQTQLSSLMKDPSSFLNSNLFKASTQAGVDAVNRSAAAGGMLKSGNRLTALMDYGQKAAPDQFYRMADLLSGLGGAKNQNPGGGLRALADLQNSDTSRYSAETSRLAQQAGANQFDINRQDQQRQQQQQQQSLDQLMQWQQQQQRQQAQQNEWDRLDNWANQPYSPSYL